MENFSDIPPRGARRRIEREIEATPPQRGFGKEWRITVGWLKRKYIVNDPPLRSVEYLELESDRVRLRMRL